jgi:hypothetical protein
LTYWPGRKLSAAGSSRSIGSRWSIGQRGHGGDGASKLATPVLQAVDEAGTRITQSERGRIWQAST